MPNRNAPRGADLGAPNNYGVYKPHAVPTVLTSGVHPLSFIPSFKMSSVPPSARDGARLDNNLREAELPADINIPDNYVDHTLKNTKPLPPVTWNNFWKELNYLSLAILTITPSVALYGAFTTKLRWETAAFAVFYYFVTGLGQYLVF